MASFKTNELALRLETPNQGDDKHYHLAIDCGFDSALKPDQCSGTHPDVLLEGKVLGEPKNLAMLRMKLQEILDALPPAPPAPAPAP